MQDGEGTFGRERFAIRPVGGQCVIDIYRLQNARNEWNLAAFQVIGIAAAVLALMMPTDDRQNLPERFQGCANALANHRMRLHEFALVRVQRPGL